MSPGKYLAAGLQSSGCTANLTGVQYNLQNWVENKPNKFDKQNERQRDFGGVDIKVKENILIGSDGLRKN